MTKEELATKLNGHPYLSFPSSSDVRVAKENNLVIVYGKGSNLCELTGAISSEIYCKDIAMVEHWMLPSIIKITWDYKNFNPFWSFETNMPYTEFKIYDGGILHCIGIVIDLNEVDKEENNKMVTAKQAHEVTQKNVKTSDERVLSKIQNKIKNAINDGQFNISEDGILPVSVRKKLEDLGYKVNFGSQYGDPYYSISWKDIQ